MKLTEEETLALKRLQKFMDEKLSQAVRIDPRTGDLMEDEKQKLVASFRAIGVMFESVEYDPWKNALRFYPENATMDVKKVIEATNPPVGLLPFLFKKNPK